MCVEPCGTVSGCQLRHVREACVSVKTLNKEEQKAKGDLPTPLLSYVTICDFFFWERQSVT